MMKTLQMAAILLLVCMVTTVSCGNSSNATSSDMHPVTQKNAEMWEKAIPRIQEVVSVSKHDLRLVLDKNGTTVQIFAAEFASQVEDAAREQATQIAAIIRKEFGPIRRVNVVFANQGEKANAPDDVTSVYAFTL